MLKKKTAVVAGGLALTLATAAIAFAYWTNSGSGTGSAASGTNGGITVKQTSTIAGLYPGGPAVPLAGNFDNLNTSNVYVHEVTATLGPVDGGSLPGPACSVDDFALTGSPASVNTEVDPGTAQGSWSGMSLRMVDNPDANQDNCKNATVHINYTSD
jgi:hypothetical protein